MPEHRYRIPLPTLDAVVAVRYRLERGRVVDFAVQLLVEAEGDQRPIRLYDTAHGYLEMHRYTAHGEKQPGKKLQSSGDWNAEMPRTIDEVGAGYERMIEGW